MRSMMLQEPTGAVRGACQPKQRWTNSVQNAIGLGHPKAVIKVIRLLVLTATVSSSLLLAGVYLPIRAAWMRAATTGRVRSVRRPPISFVTCASLAAATARTATSAVSVKAFAPLQNDCSSERYVREEVVRSLVHIELC